MEITSLRCDRIVDTRSAFWVSVNVMLNIAFFSLLSQECESQALTVTNKQTCKRCHSKYLEMCNQS